MLEAVLNNKAYMECTATGAAFYKFVEAMQANNLGNISQLVEAVRGAMVSDLQKRREGVRFESGQQSASEAFVMLLDMMEPPPSIVAKYNLPAESPINRLFLHRYRLIQFCGTCKKKIESDTAQTVNDNSVQFELFDYDQRSVKPKTPQEFTNSICMVYSSASDYKCPHCKIKVPKLHRVHQLTLVPEIIICVFQLYTASRSGPVRYIPTTLEFGSYKYMQVAQVEHSGSLHGGHYRAVVKRKEGTYLVDDSMTPAPTQFTATHNTYLVFYHYTK